MKFSSIILNLTFSFLQYPCRETGTIAIIPICTGIADVATKVQVAKQDADPGEQLLGTFANKAVN